MGRETECAQGWGKDAGHIVCRKQLRLTEAAGEHEFGVDDDGAMCTARIWQLSWSMSQSLALNVSEDDQKTILKDSL